MKGMTLRTRARSVQTAVEYDRKPIKTYEQALEYLAQFVKDPMNVKEAMCHDTLQVTTRQKIGFENCGRHKMGRIKASSKADRSDTYLPSATFWAGWPDAKHEKPFVRYRFPSRPVPGPEIDHSKQTQRSASIRIGDV
jgi:hypothetical protein